MAIAKLSLGRGATWIRVAVGMVIDRPGPWIGGFAATLGASLVLNLIPVLGTILGQILGFAMSLFFLCLADAQRKGVDFEFEPYLKQTRSVLPRLFIMGLITMGLFLISAVPLVGSIVAAGGNEFFTTQAKGDPVQLSSIILIAAGALISTVIALGTLSATWLATPQILFQKQTLGSAMRNSFKGVSTNFIPLFFYTVFMLLFFAASCVPLLLGLFVAIPATTITFYLAYEEILGKPDSV